MLVFVLAMLSCWYDEFILSPVYFRREGPDRRVVYCLRCAKPFEALSSHLKNACMKDCTPQQRSAELQRAKDSQKEWTKVGRRWDYQELSSLVPDEGSCRALADRMRSKGFFVVNGPAEAEAEARLVFPSGLA